MKINIFTQFPEMFTPVLSESILGRAAENGLLEFKIIFDIQEEKNCPVTLQTDIHLKF